jgi:hypothetical protein
LSVVKPRLIPLIPENEGDDCHPST